MAQKQNYEFYKAIHRDWQGHLMLDVADGRVAHVEAGSEGSFERDGRKLHIKWDAYPPSDFVFVEDTYYEEIISCKFHKIAQKIHDFDETKSPLRRTADRLELSEIQVFIMHYTPLVERRNYMETQLSKFGFRNVEFVVDFDRENLTTDDIKTFYKDDPRRHYEMTTAIGNRFLETIGWHPDKQTWYEGINYNHPHVTPYGRLSGAELSLCCKHASALERAAASPHDFVLILEDDAVLCDDFSNRVVANLDRTPNDWDIIFPGSALGLKAPGRHEGQVAYRMDPPHVRCSDSFFITKPTASLLRQKLVPFTLPYDFELMYWLNTLELKTYWWEPSLVVQGSETGIFSSALR